MDDQAEPLNETRESKQAEREEVVAVCNCLTAHIELPINRIKVRGCLSGKISEFEKLLKTLESYQDNGMFKKHDRLVNWAIHHYEERKNFTMVLTLKIEKSATYSYQDNWNHAKKLLNSVINCDPLPEYSDIVKARAYYLLVAHMRRKEEYRKSKTDLLFKFLERSKCLLHNYDSPEDWAELYQTNGCVWMDYMSQLPIDKRNVEEEKAMDCFRRAIYYSKQDDRERVQMKRQSYVHLKFAMMHLHCSTIALAQENLCTLNDIKVAEKHLDIIQSKFGDTIPKATRMLLSKTQSDLFYCQGQYQQAKDKAEDAHEHALHHQFNTELNTLKERKDFYLKKLETRGRIQVFFLLVFVCFCFFLKVGTHGGTSRIV